jgi:TRAP-type mannitol/chloroaromatic compound transport system substrate-binding protein
VRRAKPTGEQHDHKTQFLTKAGVAAGAAAGRSPPRRASRRKIRWRMQTYAGATLGEHVTKPAIDDAFNKPANGEMEIELFFADQIVPTGELFRPCRQAPSTRCIRTTIRWLRRWKWPCSAAISRSPPLS